MTKDHHVPSNLEREGPEGQHHLQSRHLVLETVLNTIPSPVFYKDRRGRYQGCNNAFADQILGLSKKDIVGRTLFDLSQAIPVKLAARYAKQDAALIQNAGTQFYESEVQCADGLRRHFFFNKATIMDTGGQPVGIVGVMLDITERKQAEEALRKSEERFRRFFEDVALGIFQSTEEGVVLNGNPGIANMFGFDSPGEFLDAIGEDASCLYANPEDRPRIVRLVMSSSTPVRIETRFRRRDGREFTGDLHIWKVKDEKGRFRYLEGYIDDITERKEFEKSLKESENRLRFLSSRLLEAQEEERRRISMELHDDLGQSLAALKLQMLAMSKRLGHNQSELKKECQGALSFIDRIIGTTRHLSRALSPSIIQDLKLCGTIRSMLEEFKQYATIDTALEMDDIDALFSEDQQIIIYRILQEALHNIHKHAHARSVAITIRKVAQQVNIKVRDDGQGFDIEQALNLHVADRGLGLAALEERSHMLGGQLVITSKKDRGTSIALTIPCNGQEDEA